MRSVYTIALLALAGSLSLYAAPTNGLGASSKTCVDVDGDGYGVGPLASLITTASGTVAAGSHTVTLASTAGLVTGMRVRYDINSASGMNLEFVNITVSGSTITATFLIPHASGVSVSAGTTGDSLWFPGFAADDPGCLGLDADDRDATVQTAAQGVAKYGSDALFFAKLGRDWQLYEGDVAAGQTQATAAAALLINTAHTYWLAPASASPAGNDSNACTKAAPCLTVSGLVSSAGYSSTGVGGDLVVMRQGWSGKLTLWPGASTRYNGAFSYPGEHAILDPGVVANSGVDLSQQSCGTVGASYIWVDGVRTKNAASVTGGTLGPFYCAGQTTSSNHDVLITHVDGTEGGPQGLAPISGFNGIVNWTVSYSTLHDDACPSSCNTPHGFYMGSHDVPGDHLTIRRNLVYRNSYNGIHWNGLMTAMQIDQNVVYDNGVAGMDIQNGMQNSFIRSNIIFNNNKEVSIDDYPGNCPTQSGYDSGSPTQCPHDQTGNLIESNTLYHTGWAGTLINEISDSGCSGKPNHCHHGGLIFDNTASPELNLGSNTIVDNVIVSYGDSNNTLPLIYGSPSSSGSCDAGCQSWAASSSFDHNLFWQSDGAGGTGVLRIGGNSYTCGTAGGVTTLFTNCTVADPKFINESIANGQTLESYFDFRLLPASPALNAGSVTGIPNHDAIGRAFVELAPSIGALERNLYNRGWTTLTGVGLSATVAPPNGAPLDTLNGAISSTSATTFTATNGANYFVGNIAGIESELVCINGVSGTTIVVGVNAQCSGTASGNGRGWAGTTAVTHSNGATVYLNTLTTGGFQGTGPSSYYAFQSQYTQMLTQGVGADGVARDIPGQTKQLCFGGGGHSNYVGNDIYCISPNRVTPSIALISGPSVFSISGFDSVGTYNIPTGNSPLGTSSLDAQLKDGTWNTAHIQSNFAYNPWEDKFAKFGGGYSGGNGVHGYDTFEFNFGTTAWERFTGATHDVDCTNHGTGFTSCSFAVGHQTDPVGEFNGSNFSGLAIADPLTQTDWERWTASGGNSVWTQYYPSVHQHVIRETSVPDLLCCGTSTQGTAKVLISDRRWILGQSLNGATVTGRMLDISGVTLQTPTASPNPTEAGVTFDSTCNGLVATPGPGLVYVPQISKIVGFPANTGGNTYYLMDPNGWTCTSASPSGGPPTSPFNPYIAGLMQYFPSLDAIVLVNDAGANVPRVLSLAAGDPTVGFTQGGGPTGGSVTSGSGVVGGNSVRQ
jgi:hypothetical protein